MAAHVATVLGTSAGIVGLLLHGLVAVLFGLGLLWAIVRIYSVILKIVVAAIALVEVAVLFWLLQLAGVSWLPYPVLISGLLATLCGLAYSQSKAGQRRRSIEGMLKGRVSHATLQKFLVSEAPFPFAAEKRGASRVECQISNLEELAAKLAAPDFVALNNAFCDVAANRLMESGGVVAGTAKPCAFFGALGADPAHAERANEAAHALEQRFEEFRRECLERWGVEPDCKATVLSGPMIVGIFESAISCGIDVVPAQE